MHWADVIIRVSHPPGWGSYSEGPRDGPGRNQSSGTSLQEPVFRNQSSGTSLQEPVFGNQSSEGSLQSSVEVYHHYPPFEMPQLSALPDASAEACLLLPAACCCLVPVAWFLLPDPCCLGLFHDTSVITSSHPETQRQDF